MKVWIMHDTKFGNGKNLAESLGKEFPNDYEINVGDVKEISPSQVADDAPDVLIFGGAIRMFQGAPASKKWLKLLNQQLKAQNKKIPYGTAFLTHALPTDKIQGWAKRYLNHLIKAPEIEKTYPELLTAQVASQEGPFKDDVMDKAKDFMKNFLEWTKS